MAAIDFDTTAAGAIRQFCQMITPPEIASQAWLNTTTGETIAGEWIYRRWVASDLRANKWHDPARAEERVAEAMVSEGANWIDAEGRWEPLAKRAE